MKFTACALLAVLVLLAYAIFRPSEKNTQAQHTPPLLDIGQSIIFAILNDDQAHISELVSGTIELDMSYYHEARSLLAGRTLADLAVLYIGSAEEDSGFTKETWRVTMRDEAELLLSVWKSDGTAIRYKLETEPNNAMERSQILVTDRAGARSAPSIRLAHLGR